MATKKKASAKPTQEEPISLTDFGVIRYRDGDDPSQFTNLTQALIHIHKEVKDVKPGTKFSVFEGRVEFEEEDKAGDDPIFEMDIVVLTHAELLEDYRIWNKHEGHTPFNPNRDYTNWIRDRRVQEKVLQNQRRDIG